MTTALPIRPAHVNRAVIQNARDTLTSAGTMTVDRAALINAYDTLTEHGDDQSGSVHVAQPQSPLVTLQSSELVLRQRRAELWRKFHEVWPWTVILIAIGFVGGVIT